MAHPARQVFQHIIDRDAKSSDAWLPSALSRLQSDDLGVVHSSYHSRIDLCSCSLGRVGARLSRRGYRLDGFSVAAVARSEEHTSELQSRGHLVCRLLLEKK